MKMESLEKLHRSMRSINAEMQQFRVRSNHVEFDCLFSTRREPFILALTSRSDSPEFFKFEVKRGYWIKEYFGDDYGRLVDLLKIDGRSLQSLKPKDFLGQIDACIPTTATRSDVPRSKEIVRLRQDLEEPDKPYFDAWIYWGNNSGRGPSEENAVKHSKCLDTKR